MSNIKNGGLDQYGAGPFEQQHFGTAGIEGVIYIETKDSIEKGAIQNGPLHCHLHQDQQCLYDSH